MPVVRQWIRDYAKKRMSAEDALLQIRSGSRVFLSPGCGEPQHLLEELVRLGTEGHRLNDVEIVHMLTVGSAPLRSCRTRLDAICIRTKRLFTLFKQSSTVILAMLFSLCSAQKNGQNFDREKNLIRHILTPCRCLIFSISF